MANINGIERILAIRTATLRSAWPILFKAGTPIVCAWEKITVTIFQLSLPVFKENLIRNVSTCANEFIGEKSGHVSLMREYWEKPIPTTLINLGGPYESI